MTAHFAQVIGNSGCRAFLSNVCNRNDGSRSPFSLPCQSQLVGVYAANVSHRSLAPLGMTGPRIVVIPNAMRDLYTAIPAYAALREYPPQPPICRSACGKCFAQIPRSARDDKTARPRHPERSEGSVHSDSAYAALREYPPQPAICRSACGKCFAQIPRSARDDRASRRCHPERSEGSVHSDSRIRRAALISPTPPIRLAQANLFAREAREFKACL